MALDHEYRNGERDAFVDFEIDELASRQFYPSRRERDSTAVKVARIERAPRVLGRRLSMRRPPLLEHTLRLGSRSARREFVVFDPAKRRMLVGQLRLTTRPRNREGELPRHTPLSVAVVEEPDEVIVDCVGCQPDLFDEFSRATFFDRFALVDTARRQFLQARQMIIIARTADQKNAPPRMNDRACDELLDAVAPRFSNQALS